MAGTVSLRTPRGADLDWRSVVWLLPVAAFVIVSRYPLRLHQMAAAGAALLVFAAAARRPSRAMVVLIGLLVFDQIIRIVLYRLGLPVVVVRNLASWNEVVLVGAAAAALHHAAQHRHRLDTLDRLALALLASLLLYLLAPDPFVFDELRPFDARLQSFRTHVVLIGSFLVARHIPLAPQTHRRAMRAVLVAGLVLGAQVLVEFTFSDWWNTFALEQLELNRFRLDLGGLALPNPADIRFRDSVAGREFVRVGSVAFDPIRIAFFFIIPLGIALELGARHLARRWEVVALLLSSAGAVFTFTRSAILAALVCLLVVLRPAVGRPSAPRVRMALAAFAIVVLATPGLAGSGLGVRARSGIEGSDTSSQTHLERTMDGVGLLVESPLGKGLATGPSVNERFGFSGGPGGSEVNPENSYLLIGNEIGVVPMAIFVWFMIATARRLRPTLDEVGDRAVLRSGLRVTLLGLLVGGMFLQVWIDSYTAIAFWGLAGLALNVTGEKLEGRCEARIAVSGPPSISVVLCTYQGSAFLARQLETILEQTRRADELIVCDDGSTDDTLDLVTRMTRELAGSVVVMRNPQRLGPAQNFAQGIGAAHGDLIVLADQDDEWDRHRLATLEAAFEGRPGVTALFHDGRIIDAGGVAQSRTLWGVIGLAQGAGGWSSGRLLAQLVRWNVVTGATLALRASLVPAALPIPPRAMHDQWIALVAAGLGGLGALDQPLIRYRVHEANAVGVPGGSPAQQLRRRRAHVGVRSDELSVVSAAVDRLRAAGAEEATLRILGAKREFARARSSLPPSALRRAGVVGRLVLAGSYRRFGRGLRSAAHDLAFGP